MNGSYIHLIHLLGFGTLVTMLISGIILDIKFRKENDWGLKLYLSGIMKTFGMISPFVAVIMLITGIGNIHNRLSGSDIAWYQEGWLVAKIICFAILVINGGANGPRLSKNRTMLVKAIKDKTAPPDAERKLQGYNRQITLFYIVQAVLLFAVVYLSVFGTGKHPGAF